MLSWIDIGNGVGFWNTMPTLARIIETSSFERQNVLAVEQDLSFGALLGIDGVDSVEDAQQSRLAAARRADERGDLILRDLEIDALERLERTVEEVQVARPSISGP